jgi:hypothetical protein
MKQVNKYIIIYTLSLAACLFALPCKAMDQEEYKQWEADVSSETDTLKQNLPSAMKGSENSIKALISLAAGEYIRTAEGGEWLNEIYLDLMVSYPEKFLRLLSEAARTSRKIVVQELLNPVTDKYTQIELMKAVEKAKESGMNAPFVHELLDFYSAGKQSPAESGTP